jgi:hypothetical protein
MHFFPISVEEVAHMARTSRVGRSYLVGNGASTLILGMSLFALASAMANPAFDKICYAVAVILVASSLLINGLYHGIQASGKRLDRSTAVYFIACAISVACWLIFWLIQSASTDMRLLSLLAGLQGLFWSLWYIRLALRIQASNRKAAMLCTLAATTSFLGIVLSTQSHLSTLASVTEVACFTAFIGVQILLTAIYLFRECGAVEGYTTEVSAAPNSVEAQEESTALTLQ